MNLFNDFSLYVMFFNHLKMVIKNGNLVLNFVISAVFFRIVTESQ